MARYTIAYTSGDQEQVAAASVQHEASEDHYRFVDDDDGTVALVPDSNVLSIVRMPGDEKVAD